MNREIERFASGLPIYNIRKDVKDILCNKVNVLFLLIL